MSDNRLVKRVSEISGQPVDSFTSYNTNYKDTGLFGWFVGGLGKREEPRVVAAEDATLLVYDLM